MSGNKNKSPGPPSSAGGGPPPWAGANGRVEQTEEGVKVKDNPADAARKRAEEADNQQDRIEAKLDCIIAHLEGSDAE